MFIMGASGAGKTSLLNILCDRVKINRGDNLSGSIMVNNSLTVTLTNFGKYGAYVMQDDILFPSFSCKEALTFAAKLRLGISDTEIEVKVNEIIDTLGLSGCK